MKLVRKNCEICKKNYQPTGTFQKYCKICRKVVKRNKQRQYNRTANEKRKKNKNGK